MGRKWNKEGDTLLKQLFKNNKSITDIVTILDRTRAGVLSRIRVLKLRRKFVNTKNKLSITHGKIDKRKWKESNLSYIAGFLDGEGCFQAPRESCLRIQCSNTYRPVLEWILNIFGGSITDRIDRRKASYKPLFVWYVDNRKAVECCKVLLPYLKEKKEQATLIIELHATFGTTGKRISEEVRTKRNILRQKLKDLKRVRH
jgi:hypothetical protein